MDVERENQVNVLLVDDRPENLVALEAILNSHSYNLVQANSGAEARRWIAIDSDYFCHSIQQ